MKKRYFWLIGIITAVIILRLSGLSQLITFATFKRWKFFLLHFVDSHYTLSVLLYSLLFIIISTFAIPSPTVLTVIGGFLFGIFPAFAIVMVAATIGAITSFFFARYSAGDELHKRYEARLARFNTRFRNDGHWYLLSLRMIPIVPFSLMNIFCGLTRVSLFTFVWTTILGIIPGTFVYIYAGSKLVTISTINNIFSPEIIAALVFLSLLGFMPFIVKRLKK